MKYRITFCFFRLQMWNCFCYKNQNKNNFRFRGSQLLKNTSIIKQTVVLLWKNWRKYGSVLYLFSCKTWSNSKQSYCHQTKSLLQNAPLCFKAVSFLQNWQIVFECICNFRPEDILQFGVCQKLQNPCKLLRIYVVIRFVCSVFLLTAARVRISSA